MFGYGFVSARDIMDELENRGLMMNDHGYIENKNGKPYEEPIKDRWHILDLRRNEE